MLTVLGTYYHIITRYIQHINVYPQDPVCQQFRHKALFVKANYFIIT